MSLFLWEDGAEWDWLMNYEMNDPFPEPPDPIVMNSLPSNGSFLERIGKSSGVQLTEF